MAISWAEDYQPIVYSMFIAGMQSVPSVIDQIFDVQDSQNASERHLGMEGTDIEGWDTYRKTGVTGAADFDRGFPKTFTHQEFTRAFILKQSDIEDDKLGLVADSLRMLGVSAAQKREFDAASVFNNAFSASFVGADNVALCSASHPYSVSNSAVFSNTGTSPFSYASVTATRQLMRKWTDGLGVPMMRNGSFILHPVELATSVKEVTKAAAKPGTANNDANAAEDFSSLAWDYLTDANNWWLIDPLWSKLSLKWYNRVALYNEIVERRTTHVVYEFRMRYSYGWVDPRFVYGQNVT